MAVMVTVPDTAGDVNRWPTTVPGVTAATLIATADPLVKFSDIDVGSVAVTPPVNVSVPAPEESIAPPVASICSVRLVA